MELFEPILGMIMIVVGLIMALGGMGFLLYSIWTSGDDSQSEVGQA